MSKLRPELRSCNDPGLAYRDTFYRVQQAVNGESRLIAGALRIGCDVCALGAYFERGEGYHPPLSSKAIDEIAAYNDSLATETPEERWRKVRSWLRFKVARMRKGLE